MGPTRIRPGVTLTSDQRSTLERWVRAPTTPQRLVLRSAIVLLAVEGLPPAVIAKRLHTSRATVRLWCERFRTGGPPMLQRDAPGRGRKPTVTANVIASVRDDAAGGVSIRQLARRLGASSSAVHRALAAQRQLRNRGDE